MNRSITAFHADDEGDWVAELSCGHDQHVRHRPPFLLRLWVLDDETRDDRIGSELNCPLCDRWELPDHLRFERSSPLWNEDTMPAGLQRSHRLADGTWGRIIVSNGRLGFSADRERVVDVVIDSHSTHAIAPGMEHSITAMGSVSFSIDFFSVDRDDPETRR